MQPKDESKWQKKRGKRGGSLYVKRQKAFQMGIKACLGHFLMHYGKSQWEGCYWRQIETRRKKERGNAYIRSSGQGAGAMCQVYRRALMSWEESWPAGLREEGGEKSAPRRDSKNTKKKTNEPWEVGGSRLGIATSETKNRSRDVPSRFAHA